MAGESLKLDRSLELYDRAVQVIAGGSQTTSKRPDKFAPGAFPIYLERGEGCRVWDVDGNEYLDFIMALGPINLGYAYPRVNEAIREQAERATIVSLLHPLEIELAEEIIDAVPCAEMVRFVKSGAEATSACVRTARGYTGREKVLHCGYHGWHDTFSAAHSDPKGIPAVLKGLIRSFRYNDLDGLAAALKEQGHETACIMIDPRNPAEPGFFEGVSELADQYGIVLAFDEIVSGFRLALGGAQEHHGVTPDVAAFAKAMSNGMPLAAFVGKREVMQAAADLVISTTYGNEALSLAAGLATIRELREKNVFEHTWKMGQQLMDGWMAMEKDAGIPLRVSGFAPIGAFDFQLNDADLRQDVWTLFLQETAKRGVLFRPGGLNFISYSHKGDDIRQALHVCREALEVIKGALDAGEVKALLRTTEPERGRD